MNEERATSNGAAPIAALPPGTAVPAAPEERSLRVYEFSRDLVTLSEGREAEAEAVRTIRTHIMARHVEDGRRGVAICAPTAGVGCTYTAVNLAVALSQAGLSTLLIDGDLRSPQLGDYIRAEAAPEGLIQCLTEPGRRPGDVIHHEVLPNLSLLYSGGLADNAQELLASDGFKSLIERCLRDFEFTIVDCPAANDVADALRISSVVGYSLVVAKAHMTRSADVANLVKQLKEDGAEIVGTVLSEV
ncbi:CpsD/CapB family tyrosine-protein kinase [Phenylobacterium sp.]|uniref:CpsD/CapB family tyrosine-protein kinase n=1 Tax=Phenylobacterium sp. TaxID=1871053 RepID=UPI00301E50E1